MMGMGINRDNRIMLLEVILRCMGWLVMTYSSMARCVCSTRGSDLWGTERWYALCRHSHIHNAHTHIHICREIRVRISLLSAILSTRRLHSIL
jgi:hypothetical protein